MKIRNEAFRRIVSGRNQDFEAKQNTAVKSGRLIIASVAGILGSVTLFTTTPAHGQVEGKDYIANVAGGASGSELLNQFKDWACNDLIDQTLCQKYEEAEGFEDLETIDIIEWKAARGIEDIVDGDMSLFANVPVRYIIEQRSATTAFKLTTSVECDVVFNRQATSSINLRFDGGAANWESPVFWENMDVYWDAPESISTPYLAKVIEEGASALIKIETGIGTVDYNSTVFWEYMDVDWDEEDTSGTTQFFVPKIIRNAAVSFTLNASVGTADYESSVFWEYMDVDWDEEDTSTSNQFTAKVYERTTSTSMSISMTVGTAGWASAIEWQNTDVEWDKEYAGSILQGIINLNTSLTINTNHTLIAGWKSESNPWSNLTKNWEAS